MQTNLSSEELYLDFVNNFLTVERMAERYQMDIPFLCLKIREGRLINEKWIK